MFCTRWQKQVSAEGQTGMRGGGFINMEEKTSVWHVSESTKNGKVSLPPLMPIGKRKNDKNLSVSDPDALTNYLTCYYKEFIR